MYGSALTYIEAYWPKLLRNNSLDSQTLIGLPEPYFCPTDDPIFQEMFYWDSYFIALGLVDTKFEEYIPGLVKNFSYLLRRFGLIPNASRYYFLSRSQPPFFTQLIKLAYKILAKKSETEARSFLEAYTKDAEFEYYNVWLATEHPHKRCVHRGLSRYFDANYLDDLACCESGWDHSSRCEGKWLSALPVDLNSILYLVEMDLASFADLLNKKEQAEHWRAKAALRAQVMQELFWNDQENFFLDYNYQTLEQFQIKSLAGFYPLWSGWANQEQATRLIENYFDKFLGSGGLKTSLKEKAACQWDAPNCWAPLQWIVVQGLRRYGFKAEAEKVMNAWLSNCTDIFSKTGKFWEKYHVSGFDQNSEGGLYGMVPGFGWTNAVYKLFAQEISK